MKAFVTGASGFAGGHLCRYLANEGHQVTGLVRKSSDTRELNRLKISLREGDIRNFGDLSNAMQDCDVVFHLAAAFREAKLDDSDYFAINVDGTENVIRAAAANNVSRLIHCSTIGVVGDTGELPADESRPYDTTDEPYNRSKIMGEQVAQNLFEELCLDGVIIRPTAGYGPGEMRYLKLFRNVAKGRFIIFGKGETLFNLAHIDDLCAGMLLCATKPNAVGEVFNIGSDENIPLNRFVAEVERAVGASAGSTRHLPLWPILTAARIVESLCKPFGVEPPLHRRRVGFFTVNRAANIEKARKLLGYSPKISPSDGVRILAEWYRSEGLL